MMPGLTGQKALSVSLLDISPQNKAVLEFFFAGAGRRLFKVSNINDADAFIVDFDIPNAKQNWEKVNSSLNKPTMALAFYEPDSDIIWLSKPLTTQALSDAATKVQAQLNSSKNTNEKSQATADQKTIDKDSAKTHLQDKVPTLPPIDAAPNAIQLKRKLSKIKPAINKKPVAPKIKTTPTNKPLTPPETPAPSGKKEEKPKIKQAKIKPNVKSNKPVISLEEKQKRWKKLCGDAEDIQNNNTWKDEVALYTPENYLISNLQSALRLAIQSQQMVQMKYQTATFYLIPKEAQAYCNISVNSDAFETICKTPVKKTDVVIHIMNSNEIEQAQAKLNTFPDKLHDLEGLLWTSMLLTSSGKLNKNIDLKKRVMLRDWPNFTRIETFPYVIRISALWSSEAFNMLEVAHNLQIPQRYVFAYYNAACVLGLMEHSPEKLKPRTQTKAPTENRGLFSRLLKRLTG